MKKTPPTELCVYEQTNLFGDIRDKKENIPKRYRDASLKDFEKLLPDLNKKNFIKESGYFYGDAGIGKTRLAYAMYLFFMERWVYRPENVMIILEDDIFQKIKDSYEKKLQPEQFYGIHNDTTMQFDSNFKENYTKYINITEKTIIKRLSTVDLLIIDDFGYQKSDEWRELILYKIINNRYSERKHTLFFGNYHINELVEKIGDRTFYRISHMCNVIELTGKDRRS